MKAEQTGWTWEVGEEYRLVDAKGQTVLLIGDKRRLVPMNEHRDLIAAAPDYHETVGRVIDLLRVTIAEEPGNVVASNVREAFKLLCAVQAKASGKGEV